MELILISGFSGSGKSVALNFLEDSGYYCVDNLPVAMLTVLARMLGEEGKIKRIAVAIDARAGHGIDLLPGKIKKLAAEGFKVTFLFFQAHEETLIKRYSESRRRHPLAEGGRTLEESIRLERELLDPIAELGHRIDTSGLKANALREWIRQFFFAKHGRSLILTFESFGFKYGIPLDADLVFDVRCLANPYYDLELRPLTGLDAPVAHFLESNPFVREMREDIAHFVDKWLPSFVIDNRAYLTIAIGCTGGQHRSVFIADWLSKQFTDKANVIVRHRTLSCL
ncbi:MAG: RNase adapter RapZ [Rhodocyclales bacterium]|nr:RNase adapter RapZ [Rhodocyclales bacterium]